MRTAIAGILSIIAATCAAAIPGCGVMMSGVMNPMTPQQSRSQVVDAARQVVATLGLEVVGAWFWHSACNSRGDPPFRGHMRIGYPLAGSYEAANAQITAMAATLQRAGWSADPTFHSHAPALKNNNVIVILRPQDPNAATRGVEILGECRDMTTTIEGRGPVQPVNLS